MLVGAILGGGLAIISYPLVQFFYGVEYIMSGRILTVLSTVLVFKSVSFSLAAVLVAVGWQGKRVVVHAIAAIINIIVNILIVQTHGIMGVAKVYIFTEAILMIGYMILVLRWQYRNNLRAIGSVLG